MLAPLVSLFVVHFDKDHESFTSIGAFFNVSFSLKTFVFFVFYSSYVHRISGLFTRGKKASKDPPIEILYRPVHRDKTPICMQNSKTENRTNHFILFERTDPIR